jgi:hypothetical protein
MGDRPDWGHLRDPSFHTVLANLDLTSHNLHAGASLGEGSRPFAPSSGLKSRGPGRTHRREDSGFIRWNEYQLVPPNPGVERDIVLPRFFKANRLRKSSKIRAAENENSGRIQAFINPPKKTSRLGLWDV